MALYGYDYFGPGTKYGSRVLVDFGVEPFVAESTSYGSIRLTWTEPGGNWTKFRVLRSRSGFAINEDDGLVLLSQTNASPTPGSLVDDRTHKGWYYYTVFIYDATSARWQRSARASSLAVRSFNSKNLIWSLVPENQKTVKSNTAGYSPVAYGINPTIYLDDTGFADNEQLRSFLDVFGWGFDLLRSQSETTLWGSDTKRMHYGRLALLADQMGSSVERSVPAETNRSLVRNLGLLYRKRGTESGLEEMLALATGWQVDVTTGPNLMLDEDQANFVNPQISDWDAFTRYNPDEYVKYQGRYYFSLDTAYGPSQKPPASGSPDTLWWARLIDIAEDTSLDNPDTESSVGSWQASAVGFGPLSAAGSTHVGRGVPHPTDATILNTNSLGMRNNRDTTEDLIARNVPLFRNGVNFDRELVLRSAIPVPTVVTAYRSGTVYTQDSLVLYLGAAYSANVKTSMVPTDTTAWTKVGMDDRVRLGLSFYAHGPFAGTAGTGGLPVKPYVAAFDVSGRWLYSVDLGADQVTNVNFDSFSRVAALSGRVLEIGAGKVWTLATGTLTQGWDAKGGYFYPEASRAYAYIASTLSDAVLGLTFRSVGTRALGLIFRRTDDINYWRATATNLTRVMAGVATNLATFTTPFVAGDRITVVLSGSSIIVKKNGVQVASVTDTFNSTATQHGMIFE